MPFVNYSCAELTDMLLVYGETRQNSREAVRLYNERYPQRRTPSKIIFEHIVRRLRETGSIKPVKVDSGRTKFRRTVQVEEAVLNSVERDPNISTRIISNELGNISQHSVVRVLQEQQLKPYHFTRVQELLHTDYGPRQVFCQ